MKKNQARPRKGKSKSAGAKPSASKSSTSKSGGQADGAAQSVAADAEPAPVIEGRSEETGTRKKRTNPFEFIQQVRSEATKVTWTGRNETLISSIMVLIMVLIMVVFFFFVDQTLRFGICNLLPIDCVVQSDT